MFREYLLLLLLGHVAGDFYTQTQEMADRKEKDRKWVLIHSGCYWGTMLSIGFPVMSVSVFWCMTVAAMLHMIIDLAKYEYLSWKNRKDNLFFIDQFIHIIVLTVMAYGMVDAQVVLNECGIVKHFFEVAEISEKAVVLWILALLLIGKPANIVIQKLLMPYKPEEKKEVKENDKNAGRFIGTIERIIMLIFLSIGQYSAIGLVLTAKSIARYDRISKDKDFAEYYLLGTLLSTVIVIVCSGLV